jgi:hypothetical protein
VRGRTQDPKPDLTRSISTKNRTILHKRNTEALASSGDGTGDTRQPAANDYYVSDLTFFL